MTFARDNALKTEAVADMRTVRIDALRRNLGLTNVPAVAAELQRRQESGEFKPINRQKHQPETTTKSMVAMEKENIQTMLNGKESRPAMVEAERVTAAWRKRYSDRNHPVVFAPAKGTRYHQPPCRFG